MFIRVCASPTTFQHEGFPLGGEWSFHDAINKGMVALVWVCRYRMTDSGWEGRGVVVRGDMVSWKGRCMMGCG